MRTFESTWWLQATDKEIVEHCIKYGKKDMPYDVLHKAFEKELGRGVLPGEFNHFQNLINEFEEKYKVNKEFRFERKITISIIIALFIIEFFFIKWNIKSGIVDATGRLMNVTTPGMIILLMLQCLIVICLFVGYFLVIICDISQFLAEKTEKIVNNFTPVVTKIIGALFIAIALICLIPYSSHKAF